MSLYDIPTLFKDDDIAYHYTSFATAQLILQSKRLRLSNRKSSKDPIERVASLESYSGSGSWENAKKIRGWERSKKDNAKQICFCTNHTENARSNVNPSHPYEYYGFLKPRMWNQYAEDYNGVCLAFSLSALKESSKRYAGKAIEYVDYNYLNIIHKSIDTEENDKLGTSLYWAKWEKHIERSMFLKHLDYKGENEFRIISFSENEFDYIVLEPSIKAIIVSYDINEIHKSILSKYACELGVELMYIIWSPEGVDFRTQRQIDKNVKEIEAKFEQLQKNTTKALNSSFQ